MLLEKKRVHLQPHNAQMMAYVLRKLGLTDRNVHTFQLVSLPLSPLVSVDNAFLRSLHYVKQAIDLANIIVCAAV